MAALSGGQRQSVAICRSMMWANELVFMDEPTAALGVRQTRKVLELIRRVADRGVAVVLISHNMPEVLEVSDRVEVLRLGKRVAEYRGKEVDVDELVGAMTGALDWSTADRSLTTARENEAPTDTAPTSPPRRHDTDRAGDDLQLDAVAPRPARPESAEATSAAGPLTALSTSPLLMVGVLRRPVHRLLDRPPDDVPDLRQRPQRPDGRRDR